MRTRQVPQYEMFAHSLENKAKKKKTVRKPVRAKAGKAKQVCDCRFEDMIKAGIIDPSKVARTALQNAASVAGLLLTTDLMVAEYDEKEEEKVPGAIH